MRQQAMSVESIKLDQVSTPGGSLRLQGVSGLLAGLIGGLFLGWLIPPEMGWTAHLLISALLGVGFGLLLGQRVRTSGAGLVWGECFGLAWWWLGSLILIPLALGQELRWLSHTAEIAVPLLLGQIAGFGAVLGYSYYWLARWLRPVLSPAAITNEASTPEIRRRPMGQEIAPRWLRMIIVGGLAGLLGSWVFVWGLVGTGFYEIVAEIVGSQSVAVGRILHYIIGLLIGCSFAFLFDREDKDVGASVIYGINYGLFWWMIGPMVLLPWLLGWPVDGYWSRATVQMLIPSLIGHIHYGVLVGFFYGVVNSLWHILFIASDPLNRLNEGAGTRNVRALLIGQAGGIVGGLIFTIVMAGVGALTRVASLVGAQSALIGLLVHLVISVIIGSSYGLLFYRKAKSYGEEILLGLVYGFYWWVLGALTLFAALLRQPVDWSLEAFLAFHPSLIGHLLYGAALAIFFQYLTRRYDSPAHYRALPSRPQQRANREQLATNIAPACIVVLILAVTLPLLLGG